MHHCNVDRLLALWQAMNYDVWVTEGMNREGTMGLLPGQVLTEDTRTFRLNMRSAHSLNLSSISS